MVTLLFFLFDLGVIFGCIWLLVLICRMGSPKPPKPARPVKAVPARKPPAEPRPSVSYIPRWGQYRKHSVAADKAQWETDFDRLLRG